MEGILKEIYEACHDEMGFDLTEEQCKDILKNVPALEHWGIDTMAKGDIANYLSNKLCVFCDWPIYGSSDETKDDFWVKMKIGAEKYGYKLLV
jgi:hypothetical protein